MNKKEKTITYIIEDIEEVLQAINGSISNKSSVNDLELHAIKFYRSDRKGYRTYNERPDSNIIDCWTQKNLLAYLKLILESEKSSNYMFLIDANLDTVNHVLNEYPTSIAVAKTIFENAKDNQSIKIRFYSVTQRQSFEGKFFSYLKEIIGQIMENSNKIVIKSKIYARPNDEDLSIILD